MASGFQIPKPPTHTLLNTSYFYCHQIRTSIFLSLLFLCMCSHMFAQTCVCLCVCVHMTLYVCGCGGQRSRLGKILHWNWSSPTQLDFLSTKLSVSFCIYFPRAQIMGSCCYIEPFYVSFRNLAYVFLLSLHILYWLSRFSRPRPPYF